MANNDISFQCDIGLVSAPSMGHQSTVECFVNDWHALVSIQMFEYITLEFPFLPNTSLFKHCHFKMSWKGVPGKPSVTGDATY